jgi:photosystem II stability/assembly factor-like uncharacterized protein
MVMRSTDTGQTWEQLDLGYDGTLFAANGGEGEAWIGGLRGNVFHSRDAGQNWQRLLQKTEASLLGSIIDGAGRARFVGLSGMLVEIERDSGQAVRVSQISPLTLAAIMSVSEQGTVLVGSAGVTRLDEKGSIVPVSYVEYRK